MIATTLTHPVESLGAAHYLIDDLTGIEVTVYPATRDWRCVSCRSRVELFIATVSMRRP